MQTIDPLIIHRRSSVVWLIVLAFFIALALAMVTTMPTHAAPCPPCVNTGTVTNVTPYPDAAAWWVAIHYDDNTWSSFASRRGGWTVNGRAVTIGPAADAARYSQPWYAFSR